MYNNNKLCSRLVVAQCERGEDWGVLKRTLGNLSFLSVCSPEKDCWRCLEKDHLEQEIQHVTTALTTINIYPRHKIKSRTPASKLAANTSPEGNQPASTPPKQFCCSTLYRSSLSQDPTHPSGSRHPSSVQFLQLTPIDTPLPQRQASTPQESLSLQDTMRMWKSLHWWNWEKSGNKTQGAQNQLQTQRLGRVRQTQTRPTTWKHHQMGQQSSHLHNLCYKFRVSCEIWCMITWKESFFFCFRRQ